MTSSKRLVFALLALTMVLLLAKCNVSHVAGGGTETGNPTIAAMVRNPGGTPARHAKVRFYPVGYNPHPGLAKMQAVVDSATTDINGNYVATLDTGKYNVLAAGDSGVLFQDSITVVKDTTVHPPADTLKAPGSLTGVIRLQPGDDARKVFILVMGTNTFSSPSDSVGNFSLASMAQGSYSVRILSVLDNYGVLDTSLAVIAGKNDTLPDTIVLPYTGIPVPSGLKISYDTLKQIVNLSWNKPATGRSVKGYNIYRMNVDSNTTLATINLHLVTDTAYSDSTGVQDQTYAYRVAAVDSNGTEGVKSAEITVTISTYFLVDSLFGSYGTGPSQFEDLTGMAVDQKGDLCVADAATNRIQVFNSNLAYQSEIDSPYVSSPTALDVDSSGNIYTVINRFRNVIRVFSPNGTLTDSIVLGTGVHGQVPDICIHNNELFVVIRDDSAFTFDDTIKIMGLDGTIKRSWPVAGVPEYICVNGSNNVFLTGTNSIQVYDTLGNFTASIAPTGFTPDEKSAFDSKGRLIVDQNGSELWVFDKQDNLFAKYDLRSYMPLGENIAGSLCTMSLAGKDFIYVEILGGAATKIIKLSNMLP